MTSGKSNLVKIDHVTQIHETEKAYAVNDGSVDEDGKKVAIWLPKSQVQKDGETFTMPEWLAKDKELV